MEKRIYANEGSGVTELERENQKKVMELAGECAVILENDGTLPLKGAPGKIALYGNGARDTIKGGTGSGDVNTRESVNIEQGMAEAGFQILTTDWLEEYDRSCTAAKEAYVKEVDRIAAEKKIPAIMVTLEMPYEEPDAPLITEKKDTDTAVYVLARNSGEGKDRAAAKGDYYLTDREAENIRFLARNYEKCIVLLNTGGIIDTTVLKSVEGLNALVIVGQLGNMGGRITADILLGKVSPSGKLADTWAASYADYPSSETFSHNNGNVDDEYYTEGIFVGYRYFDTFGVEPNYCFGYGKTYTEFEIGAVSVSLEGEEITVRTEVTNVGSEYSGREVVQVYYSAPEGKLEKPYQELAAFAKTGVIEPGARETVIMKFPARKMASYSEAEAAWILEPGEYILRVGKSSRNTKAAAVLSLAKEVKTEQLTNIFPKDQKFEEIQKKPCEKNSAGEPEDTAIRLDLNPAAIITKTVQYQGTREEMKDHHPDQVLTLTDVKAGKAPLEDLVAQLTVEEMAEYCVGTERYSADGGNVVGSASETVPGAAGETWNGLWESRKIPAMILSDGPAGLRLQPHFKTTAKGERIPGGEVFGLTFRPFPENLPEDTKDYYQYCTAIPIAATLAQSWDMELIQKMGEIVGAEMKHFHVHLWLAPGMNIHRNPLCGRNFEYYSEDPLLAGSCAAADTKGVQSLGGQGTTIKHLAANNQEDNRMFNNAHVSERAMREIYLKGFEIAVKESQPYAIMTSYNLINGIHSANNYDLLQKAVRDEWGFEGLVMTDWYSSQDTSMLGSKSEIYPWASSTGCIKAGNDMQMPGCEQNVTDIIEGVKASREITLADLQFCMYNILKVAVRL